jgi:hypothetical protein
MVYHYNLTRTHTVIRFLLVSARFGTCTVVSANGTLVEDKMSTFIIESTHFIFNKCPFFTHDGASAKFSTNSHETDYSACVTHLNSGLDTTSQGFGSGSAWIRINLSCWIRIRIQIADPDPDPGGQK